MNAYARISTVLFLTLLVLSGCASQSARSVAEGRSAPAAPSIGPLERFAMEAPFTDQLTLPGPVAPPAEVVAVLKAKAASGETDHLMLLVEYGLRVHVKYMERTSLARELPLDDNMMLSELVRIAGIPRFTSAHEAGWLDRQFDGYFSEQDWPSGRSSYQVFLWAREHNSFLLSSDAHSPDEVYDRSQRRALGLMKKIENSNMGVVGGDGVCHYGCI